MKLNLIDSHCHLDFEPLSNEQKAVIERAYKAGVTKMINVGSSLRGSRASVELANKYPNIWASVGLHPHGAETIADLDSAMGELRYLAQSDKVVAIGEIGLDFFDQQSGGENSVSDEIKKAQIKLFKEQLKIAQEIAKPIILHIRDSWQEAYKVISNFKFQISNSRAVGVVHCFTGGPKEAEVFLDLGFCIGFTGFVTFEQSKFDLIREAVKIVPKEKILIETDAPFLAPEPYRGKPNEPAYLVEIAKKIAHLKNLNPEEIFETTSHNIEKLFSI